MPYYTVKDIATIVDFIKANPFAMLAACKDSMPVATQIPFLIENNNEKITLCAHIMKNTDHHLALVNNPNTLVTFTGAHCYVSSSWYSYKGEGATWNYMTVQTSGKVEFLSEEETIDIIGTLTDKYETYQPNPQMMADIPQDYIHKYVKAVAGIKIAVDKVEATFKLSQNRDDESYKNIVEQLESIGNNGEMEIATAMRKLKPELF